MRAERTSLVALAGVLVLAFASLAGCTSGLAPSIRKVVTGDGHTIVYWSAPPVQAGLTVDGYVVTAYRGLQPQARASFGAATRGGVVSGLTNGSSYTFVIHAVNDLGGNSARSAPSQPVTPSAIGKLGVTEPDYVNDGQRVAMFGDSITASALPQIRSATRGASLRVAAWSGEGWSGGPWSDGLGGPVMRSIAGKWASTDPAVVVFALGTNDAWSADLSLGAALAAMDEVIARFPDACLAGVEVNEISPASGYQQAEAVAINEAMRQELDVTAAWVTPEGLRPDGIHANAVGRRDFAEAVLDGIMRCAA